MDALQLEMDGSTGMNDEVASLAIAPERTVGHASRVLEHHRALQNLRLAENELDFDCATATGQDSLIAGGLDRKSVV